MCSPTPCPQANLLLSDLLAGARSVLGEAFVGMYLYGSLALGDFDPASSDIDFVVVTAGELPAESVTRLEALHGHLALSHPRWAPELEGSYIPAADLRRYDPARACHLHVFAGKVFMEEHGIHWVIERHVLREHGVVLAGPAPRSLIDPVSPGDLRSAVAELMRSWWLPMAENPDRLYDAKYLRYALVTMCRVLYTLRHGAVVSKPAAMRWALETVDCEWRPLLESTPVAVADMVSDRVNGTRAFIRFTAACMEPSGRDQG